MARGPLRKETLEQRALAATAKAFGLSFEELQKLTPPPIETQASKLDEAQAAATFLETKGEDFKYRDCEICGRRFAFKWHSNAVRCCSAPCIAKKLDNMGLKWDPNKNPEERWGYSVPPLIVSSYALDNIRLLLDEILKDQPDNKHP